MGSLVAELAEKLSSATNSIDFDEQTLFLNTSANTVGVGTNAPASKFDVRGTMQVGIDDTGHDVTFFGATASRYWWWDESDDGVKQRGTLTVGVDDTGHDVKFFGATATNGYMLWDESTDDLILGSASKVGIGTTAPSSILTVAGTGGTTVSAIENYGTTAGQGAQLNLSRSNNGTLGTQTAVDADDLLGEISYQGSSGSAFVSGARVAGYADETFSGTAAGSTLRFYTADNTTTTLDERMRITSAGLVGIGTTAPATLLHLQQSNTTALSAGSDTFYGLNIHNTGGLNAISSLTFTGADHTGDGSLTGIYAKHTNVTENSEAAELHLITSHSEALVEAMTISSAGKVGIGTTVPANDLEIGAYSGDKTLCLTSSTNGTTTIRMNDGDESEGMFIKTVGGGSYATMHIGQRWSSDTNKLTIIGSTGRVGIGTDAPANNLHIKAASCFVKIDRAAINESSGVMYYTAGTENSGSWAFYHTGGAHSNFVFADWYLSDVARWTIDTSGVVSGNFNDTSDRGKKENIETMTEINGLTFVNKLRPVIFDWKYDDISNQSGFIAQEVEEHNPNLVSGEDFVEEDSTTPSSNSKSLPAGKSLNTIGIMAHLTKAIQELSTKVTALENA